jgi:hypothetical protein
MHTTFFFVLLAYYVYNYMFLHIFKTYKMYKIYKIHKPLPVSGFHMPIIRSYLICEVANCTSTSTYQMLR